MQKRVQLNFVLFISIVMKRICFSLSMFSYIAKQTCKCMNLRIPVIIIMVLLVINSDK